MRLFVYGTLLPGGPLWPELEPFVRAWEPAEAPGRLWDTGRGYPAAHFDDRGSTAVPGVLVDVSPEAWPVLDDIEEVGVLYRRVHVTTSAGAAIAYEWLGSTEGMAALVDGWPDLGN